MKKQIILVIGTAGQFGTKLTIALRQEYGRNNVIATGATEKPEFDGRHLNVLNTSKIKQIILDRQVTQVYFLAAMLSGTGEQQSASAWGLNVTALLAILEIARDLHLEKVFWPSSIAVFGPGSPKYNCPQQIDIEPATVDGISKRAGEYWGNYYFEKHGVDVRSLRFPGLIGDETTTGCGITEYAVEIFHQALEKGKYTCYLSEDNCLPLIYIDDAVRATLELMEAPGKNLTVRNSYNLAGCTFAPCDLVAEIKKYIPAFRINYLPDSRDTIAKSLPASIDDLQARKDWGWKPNYGLTNTTKEMLYKIAAIKNVPFENNTPAYEFFPDYPADNGVFTHFYDV